MEPPPVELPDDKRSTACIFLSFHGAWLGSLEDLLISYRYSRTSTAYNLIHVNPRRTSAAAVQLCTIVYCTAARILFHQRLTELWSSRTKSQHNRR